MSTHTPEPLEDNYLLDALVRLADSPITWLDGHKAEVDDAMKAAREAIAKACVRHAALTNSAMIAAVTEMFRACQAALVYDRAIESCANDPNKMSSFCTAQGDDLDALYLIWRDLSRAAIAKVKGVQA